MARIPVFVLVAFLFAAPALAEPATQSSTLPMADPEMKAACETMMAKMAAMQKEEERKRAELEKKLDELMAAMKSAKGKDKADAVALVVEELVARCRAMEKGCAMGTGTHAGCCMMMGGGCGMGEMGHGCAMGAGCMHHGQGMTGMGHGCGMMGQAPAPRKSE